MLTDIAPPTQRRNARKASRGDTVVAVRRPPHVLLSVLISREDEHWIAQLLEHDFAAHGPNREAALKALARIIQAHVRLSRPEDKADPLADVPPAPMEFWDAWKQAPRREEPTQLTPADVDYPPAYVVQAILDSESLLDNS